MTRRRMMMIGGLGVLAGAAGTGAWVWQRGSVMDVVRFPHEALDKATPAPGATGMISAAGVSVVRKAARAEALRAEPFYEGKHVGVYADKTDGYGVLSRATLRGIELNQLRDALLDDRTYANQYRRYKCGGFVPRHMAQFAGDGRTVTFLICIGCQGIGVVVQNRLDRIVHARLCNWGPASDAVKEVVRAVFPPLPATHADA
jgi:hypothetical protein